LQNSHTITLRDDKSAALVKQLTGKEVEVTADPVWLLEVPDRSRDRKSMDSLNIGISLRTWPSLTPERIRKLVQFFQDYTAHIKQPVQFILLPFQKAQDLPVLEIFVEELSRAGFRNYQLVAEDMVLETIGICHLLFGMRFHSLILALLSDIPVFGLMYDPKVQSLLEMLKLEGCPIEGIETLKTGPVEQYFQQYQAPSLEGLREKASVNFQRLESMIL
jgi:polysaccharide pyruvyl transferase WcaK-like protein